MKLVPTNGEGSTHQVNGYGEVIMSSSNEASGSALFEITELAAVRRSQPFTR